MFTDESGEERSLEKLESVLREVRNSASPEPDAQASAQELKFAWLRAVAIVWSDPAKLELLKRDPRQFFADECGYTLPGNLVLTVREAQEAGGSWEWNQRSLPKGEVTLYVPPPPELSDQPIAMADLASAIAMVAVCPVC
jgi:ribosomally synthesized peptide (two-chain TOMM family)